MALPSGVRVTKAVTVTPSDATEYDPPLEALWVDTAGTLVLTLEHDSSSKTITVANDGYELRGYRIKKVGASSTATGLIGFR